MKRLALLLLLLASPAFAQRGNIYSTKAQEEFSKALTEGVLFGVPRYTTVALPICDATQVGALAWNTTTNTLWGCNGIAWAAVDAGGGGGVTPGSNNDFTGINTFIDGNLFVIGSGDPTKRLRFEVDSFIPSGFTRVMTVPNGDGNLCINALNCNWTVGQTFGSTATFSNTATFNATAIFTSTTHITGNNAFGLGGGVAAGGGIAYQTNLTPDSGVFYTGPVGNSIHFYEVADAAFDFNNGPCGTAACTDPSLIVHSHGAATNEWMSLSHDGSYGFIKVPSAQATASGIGFGGGALGATAMAGIFINSVPYIATPAAGLFAWSGGTTAITATDTGLSRAAAGVVRPVGVNGGAAGWFQQWAGDVALLADYTNATATFTNLLSLNTNVAASRTYSFTFVAFFSESVGADGAQFDFGGGTATATNFRVHCAAVDDNGAPVPVVAGTASSTALNTALQYSASTTGAMVTCEGTLAVNVAGTFIVRAAQISHTTGTLTVHRGSWINVRDTFPK